MVRLLSVLAVVAGLAAGGALAAPSLHKSSSASSESKSSRVLGVPVVNADASNTIANSYIVVYNTSMSDAAIRAHQNEVMGVVTKRNIARRHARHHADSSSNSTASAFTIPADTAVRTVWVSEGTQAFRAMTLSGADDHTMLQMFNAPEVAYIEQDAWVSVQALATETGAPSGLERLSHASASAASGAGYVFDDTAGAGITAFVVDTGIQTTHSEFEGRAVFGANFVDDVDTDANGHGTHVSGTLGGRTFGVAKSVDLVAVKVLDADGAGTNSGVLAGMNWVAENATARGLAGKAVLNMSLGGGRSRAVNAAVAAIADAGVVPVVAAGNEAADARNTSPASANDAIAVGAIDQLTDGRASFSNFGADVAIFAPGVDVLSSFIGSDTASEVLSGTSMASPHVAGLAAYLMALEGLTTPAEVRARMEELAAATGARVRNSVGDTTRLIANNGNL